MVVPRVKTSPRYAPKSDGKIAMILIAFISPVTIKNDDRQKI